MSPQSPASDQFPNLPALKRLGSLSELLPTIVTDTREQVPLVFRRLPSIRGTLQSGDYSVAGLEHQFAIERKSVSDLVACCTGENRERFERELHRLRGFRFARLLIVGTQAEVMQHRYRSNLNPKVVMNSLSAFEARYIPVVWAATPEEAARQVETWAWWFARETVEATNSILRGSPDCRVTATNPQNTLAGSSDSAQSGLADLVQKAGPPTDRSAADSVFNHERK